MRRIKVITNSGNLVTLMLGSRTWIIKHPSYQLISEDIRFLEDKIARMEKCITNMGIQIEQVDDPMELLGYPYTEVTR